MKKVTKKFLGEFNDTTKGELQWSVFRFDKQTGKRDMAYGGHNFMSAFAEMTNALHNGFDVILTDKAGWDYSNNIEWNEHRRITYAEMKPYEITIDEFNFEIHHYNK